MAEKKTTSKSTPLPPCLGVFVNKQYKTCIGLERRNGYVHVLILDMARGLITTTIAELHFDVEWRLADKSSVIRAAKIYAEYMRYLGASDEALTVLKQFTPLTPQEVLMAKTKASERANPVVPASSAKGKALAKAAEKKQTGVKKETSKAMFIQLIMEGKLTDNQIFAKVKEKFGLPEKSRTHVSWYRSQLRADGKNPPPAKSEKSPSTKPTTKTPVKSKPSKPTSKSKPKKAKSAEPKPSLPTDLSQDVPALEA